MLKNINFRKLIIFILGTIIIGSISAIFIGNDYEQLIKPVLSPPGYIFPIVWTMLYTLMGISLYIISETESNVNPNKAYTLYLYQLIVNSLWTVLFFGLNLTFISFLWIILLIILVILMIKEFLKINKTAAYLQIPYLIWLLFALYLNFGFYILNK